MRAKIGGSQERIARAKERLREGWGCTWPQRRSDRSAPFSDDPVFQPPAQDSETAHEPRAVSPAGAALVSRRRILQGSLLIAAAGAIAGLPRGRGDRVANLRVPRPEPFEAARYYPLDSDPPLAADEGEAAPSVWAKQNPAPLRPRGPERKLALFNENTGESVTATFWSAGDYVLEELESIHWLLRDHHVDEMHAIDLHLVEMLYTLRTKLDTNEPLHILSAYRTPTTNAKLRGIYDGVAVNSFHIKGQAVDLYVPGRRKRDLLKAARALRAGGVGNYRTYVHVDTGPLRFW